MNAMKDVLKVSEKKNKIGNCIKKNSTKTVETPEQTIRRKLMARLRAQRAREKKKAQALDFSLDNDGTSSSSESKQNKNNWDDPSCDTNLLAFQLKHESDSEVELPAAINSDDVLPTLDLDPLKMESNEDGSNAKVIVDSTMLVRDFVAEEIKRMRHADANAIHSGEEDDDEGEHYFRKAFQAERLRIENALKHAEEQNELTSQNVKIKEEEPTIDFITFNSLNEWNPLDCSRDGSFVDEGILDKTFKLGPSIKTTKRQVQAERMRKLRARKKQLETPEETFKRKENQRQRAERARLKKKALQAGVLTDSEIDVKHEDEGHEDQNLTRPKRLTRFQVKQNEVADEVNTNKSPNSSLAQSRKQLEDVLNADHSCGSIDSQISSSESATRNRSRCAQRARERRAAETIEETEARRLRARIAKMKNRLYAQLGISEDQLQAERARKAEEMRLLRQKKRAAETPEQAAERKRKQVLQARKSRSRILAAETPEETAARRAAGREYCRKRLSKLEEKETPEEKAERKERERQHRKQIKNIKLKNQVDMASSAIGNASSLNSSNMTT